MAWDWKKAMGNASGVGGMAGGIGGIASGLGGLFGGQGKTPGQASNDYIGQIPGQTAGYYDPYNEAGKNQLQPLQDQYSKGMSDPGGKYNEIGQSFQQSPGFKFAMEQALGANDRLAGANGMGGSPMNSQQDMQLATDLANQDYYNYMGGATGLYNNAMTGAQGMANQGQQAGNNQANMIAQTLAQQGNNAYEDQAAKNKRKAGAFSDIAGGLGQFAGGAARGFL